MLNKKPANLWLSPYYHKKRDYSQNKTRNVPTKVTNNKKAVNTTVDEWDQISLQAIQQQNHNMIIQENSPYQHVQLVEATDLRLYLDEQLQFSSLDEHIYHEALVHPAFLFVPHASRVLIVGGGDGLALREVLKYQQVLHVDLVDLDPIVLNAAANNPNLVTLNKQSFYDSRANIHCQDANKFLTGNIPPYDIIIVDFPDPTNEITSNLYTVEFYTNIHRFLSDDGIIVCQSNSPEDTPIVYWSIAKTIQSAGFNVTSYHTIVPSFGDWGFHLASKTQLTRNNSRLQVQTITLRNNIEKLFSFPTSINSMKEQAIINSKQSLSLHETFLKEIKDL
ncbi:spermidine synthase [Metabacillus iocasae]|uniref:Polyamine aminopropyltransferase n=1 Tax=Priestia iocasae TaxID=2291674 RepID=A0ABS2QUX5_9BACI|nr:spermidine synthase [Metabacillus iocasae]MBM7703299.1 spermidine synthase [Metabacillus iocasae]